MFILPNDKQLDYEAVIDAMIDKEYAYWLDINSGECLLENNIIKNNGRANFQKEKNNRYFKVPGITDFNRLRWMVNYIAEMVEFDDKKLAGQLKNIMFKENPYENFLKILEEKESEGWIYGWNSWEGDNAFEEMKGWFATLPFDIKEEMDVFDDCDCPACRAMKEDRTSEEELKGAFREANFKDALGNIYEQADPDNEKTRK